MNQAHSKRYKAKCQQIEELLKASAKSKPSQILRMNYFIQGKIMNLQSLAEDHEVRRQAELPTNKTPSVLIANDDYF